MEYKQVATARVKSIYNDLLAMDKKSMKLQESLETTTVSLQERKRNMEKLGLKFESFKSDIVKVSREHYELEILTINIKHLVSSLYETLLQVGIAGLSLEDLGIEEDAMGRIKEIAEQARPVFSSEKGEVIIANEDLHSEIFQSVEARVANEEVLKKTFELIPTDGAKTL